MEIPVSVNQLRCEQIYVTNTDAHSTIIVVRLEDGTVWKQYFRYGSLDPDGWDKVELPNYPIRENLHAAVGYDS